LVAVASIVDAVHVSNAPIGSLNSVDVPVTRSVLITLSTVELIREEGGQGLPAPGLIVQRVVAEALPATPKSTAAEVAKAARQNSLRCFIWFLLESPAAKRVIELENHP